MTTIAKPRYRHGWILLDAGYSAQGSAVRTPQGVKIAKVIKLPDGRFRAEHGTGWPSVHKSKADARREAVLRHRTRRGTMKVQLANTAPKTDVDLAFRFRHGWIPLHPDAEKKLARKGKIENVEVNGEFDSHWVSMSHRGKRYNFNRNTSEFANQHGVKPWMHASYPEGETPVKSPELSARLENEIKIHKAKRLRVKRQADRGLANTASKTNVDLAFRYRHGWIPLGGGYHLDKKPKRRNYPDTYHPVHGPDGSKVGTVISRQGAAETWHYADHGDMHGHRSVEDAAKAIKKSHRKTGKSYGTREADRAFAARRRADRGLSNEAPETDVQLGRDGSKWRHGWIPLNPQATAIKLKREGGNGRRGFRVPHPKGEGHYVIGETPDGKTAAIHYPGGGKKAKHLGRFERPSQAERAVDAHSGRGSFKPTRQVNGLRTANGPYAAKELNHTPGLGGFVEGPDGRVVSEHKSHRAAVMERNRLNAQHHAEQSLRAAKVEKAKRVKATYPNANKGLVGDVKTGRLRKSPPAGYKIKEAGVPGGPVKHHVTKDGQFLAARDSYDEAVKMAEGHAAVKRGTKRGAIKVVPKKKKTSTKK